MKSSHEDHFYHAENEIVLLLNAAKGEKTTKLLAKPSTITRLFSLNLSSTRTTGEINGLALTSSSSHLSSDIGTEDKDSLDEALENSLRYLQESVIRRKNSRLHIRKNRPFDTNSSDKEERPSGPAQKAKSIFHRPANHRPSISKASDGNTTNKLYRGEIVFSSQNSNSKVLNHMTAATQKFTDQEALLPTSKFFLEGRLLRFYQSGKYQDNETSHVASSSVMAETRESRDEDSPKEPVVTISSLLEQTLVFVRENLRFKDSHLSGIKFLMSSTSFSVLFNELAPMLKGYYRNSILENMGETLNSEAPGENSMEMVKKDLVRALRTILQALLKEIMDLTVKESTSFFYRRLDSTERDNITIWAQYWCQLIEIWTFFNRKIRYQALCTLHSLEFTVVIGGWFPNDRDENSARVEIGNGVDNILLLSFGETIIIPAMHTWNSDVDEETRRTFFFKLDAEDSKVLHMLKACFSSVDLNASYFKQLDQYSYGAFQDFTRQLDRVLISLFAPSSPAQQISYS